MRAVRPELAAVWQAGFFDHSIRQDEDLRANTRYIIANPLRAGLCAQVGDYPWWDARMALRVGRCAAGGRISPNR